MAPQVSEPVGPTDEGDMVASVMRPAVTTVDTRGHLAAAAYRMNHASQSALVVVDDVDRPVAMITERDLMRAVAHGAAPGEARIEDWMDRSPRTVRPETAMTEAAQIMLHTAQRHLPVVSDGRLEGIVAISDIADAFVGSVRLAAVVVFVSDLTRSLGFYQPLLRFTITVSDVDAALLTGPDGSQLYLHQVNDSSARRDDGVGVQRVAWIAGGPHDLDRCTELLKEQGAYQRIDTVEGITRLEGRDPDGLLVIITYPGLARASHDLFR